MPRTWGISCSWRQPNSPVSAPADDNVHVHLARERCQHLTVARRNDLLPVNRAYADVGVVEGEGEGEVGVLRSAGEGRGIVEEVIVGLEGVTTIYALERQGMTSSWPSIQDAPQDAPLLTSSNSPRTTCTSGAMVRR